MDKIKQYKIWTYLMEGRARPVKPSHVLCYIQYATERGVPFDVHAPSGREAKQIAARMRAEMEALVDKKDDGI